MDQEKNRRIATAVGFLCGMLACLDAVRDARILWPPDVLWDGLLHRQRLELGGGIAVILVALVTTLVSGRR